MIIFVSMGYGLFGSCRYTFIPINTAYVTRKNLNDVIKDKNLSSRHALNHDFSNGQVYKLLHIYC